MMPIGMNVIRGRFGLDDSDIVAKACFESMLVSSSTQWFQLAAMLNRQHRHNTTSYGMSEEASWDLVGKTGLQVFKTLATKG
jgi:hypothetical protein